MRKVILLFVIILPNFNIFAQQNQSINLYGEYKKGLSDIGTKLILNNNNSFFSREYSYSDCESKNEPYARFIEIRGLFKIDSNTVKLYPESYVKKEVYADSTIVIDSAKYYESDSTSIKTIFTIVKWNNNIYLLSETSSYYFGYRTDNDFVLFANNYNSGNNPLNSLFYFVKGSTNKRFEKIDLHQIPKKWRKYFLDTVLHVVVTDINKAIFYDTVMEANISRFILKGGFIDGVQPGMEFYGKKKCCLLKIYEVFAQKSIGIIELCPKNQNACSIGDTLTSWNENENGKYRFIDD